MTTRDLSRHLFPAESIRPAARAASVNGENVDLQGHDAAFAIVQTGAHGDGAWTPKLQHADDNGAGAPGAYADVDAADLVGAFVALAANQVQTVGYRGTKRWLRLVGTAAGVTTNTTFGGVIVRGLKTHNLMS